MPTTDRKLKFYELPGAFFAVNEAIDLADGEVTDEVMAELDRLELNLAEKADAVAALIRESTAEGKAYGEEEKHLARKRRVAEARADRLKEYMVRCLAASNIDKVKGVRFTVRVQQNGQASVRWTRDPDQLPEGFRRVTVEADLEAARQALQHGCLPEGFDVTIGSHLRIQWGGVRCSVPGIDTRR